MALWQSPPQNKDRRNANDFSGGVNTSLSAIEIKENESTQETGFDFDVYPALTVRKGRTVLGDSGVSITRLLTVFGHSALIRACGTALQYNTGSGWITIPGTFANTDWDATNFDIGGPAAILTNGTDAVYYWNGSTLTPISTAPKGKYIASDNRRVYIAKDDTITYCAFQDALVWNDPSPDGGTGTVQYYTPYGGDITALHAFQGQIWAFKKDAFALIFHTGDARVTHRLVEGSNNIGCVSHKTVVEVGEILFWLGADDVYMGAGGSAQGIGQNVRKYLSNINRNAWSEANAWTDGIKYYLCIPTGVNTTCDTELVYDPRYKKWHVRSTSLGGQRYGAFWNNTPYGGFSDGKTYQLNVTDMDDGTPYLWNVVTKPFDEGQPEAAKEYYELHIQAYIKEGSLITVSISTDERGEDFTELYSFSAVSTVKSANIIVPMNEVPICHYARLKINGQGYVEIHQIQRYFRVHPVQH